MKNKLTKALALLLSVSMITCTTDIQVYAGEIGKAMTMEEGSISGNEETMVSENQSDETENVGWDGVTTESIFGTEKLFLTREQSM